MPFAFTPPDGLRDSTAFPTRPPSEAQYRADFQTPHDQTRDYINSMEGGWIPVGDTWTYQSVTGVLAVVTVPAGAVNKYRKGDKVKLFQDSVTKYGLVAAVADTALTILCDKDTLLTSSAISSVCYSHAATPVGFPVSFGYTPTVRSSTGTITSYTAAAKIIPVGGKLVMNLTVTVSNNGTGAGSLIISLPVTQSGSVLYEVCVGRYAEMVTGTIFANTAEIQVYTGSNTYPVSVGNTLLMSATITL